MNVPAGGSLADDLEVLAGEILRWNRSINLVTRVDTGRQLDRLIRHCLAGWELAAAHLAANWAGFGGHAYVDLGSGGGLPGLVWAAARRRDARADLGPTHLVEPRAKRAWFLQRTIRAMALEGVAVAPIRWGEGTVPAPGLLGRPTLVSLKALRLDDSEVATGLIAADPASPPPPEVAILRFLPLAGSSRSKSGDGPESGSGIGPGTGSSRDRRPGGDADTVVAGDWIYTVRERRILGQGAPRLGLAGLGGPIRR
jgi:hypothetical protein